MVRARDDGERGPHGRRSAGAWAAIPVGVLLGGLAVEAVGVRATFLAIGVCYVAVTVYGFFNPAFRDLDRAPEHSAADPAR
jgi:hypothetical protein